VLLRRADPSGAKAGALNAGLAAQTAPVIAVFDADFVPNVDFLFLDEPVEDEKSWSKAMKPGIGHEMLTAALERFADPALPWEAEALKGALEETGASLGLKLGKAQAPVRVAVTGRTVGLPLFESLELLGRERVRERLRAALAKLERDAPASA
jgi:glutamyl-tRNA synthetase